MKVGLISHTSPSTNHLSDFIHQIDKLCEVEFSGIILNNELDGFYIGINLSEFEPKNALVTHFHYSKAEKTFEFDLNVEVEKYLKNNYEEFKSNLFVDLKRGLEDVFEKKIKNMLLGNVVLAVFEKAIFGKSSQNIDSLLSEILKATTAKPTKKEKPKIYTAMVENRFWKIIEQSFLPGKNFADNLQTLENKLSLLKDEDIIGFNITLRGFIEKLNSEFVINKAKLSNGYVTDDPFIYLRYKLITKGEAFFDSLVTEKENSFKDVYVFDEGEELVHTADNAIRRKHGENYGYDMPSSISNKIYGPLL